jgi:omega-amidase
MPETEVTISLIQMDCLLGKPKENFARAAALIAEARRRGSDLVVLPELWSTAYDLENAGSHAALLAGRTRGASWFGRFAGLAKANRLWLTGSLLEMQADGKYYNCMPVYGPDGALKAAYRKIHLFRLMEEDVYLAPGQDTTLLNLPWGRTGLAICYDLRFPELFRRYALNGAQLLLIPAEWPSARQEHWRTLLRARAIENQCYVAACNRVGTSQGIEFCGRSAVIDPWGETLIEGGADEDVLTISIDLGECAAARQRIPVFDDRRPELY